MATLAALIAYALLASVLIALIYAARSVRLRNRFVQLGELKGRTLDEVLKFAGKPSHRARINSRRELLEWRQVGFHIALTFTDGVCDGVTQVC